MGESLEQHRKPRILVSGADHDRLVELASAALRHVPEVAGELLAEMARAEIVADGALPDAAIRMGSTVSYRSDDGRRRRVTLVFPGGADIAAGRVSVMTPVGAALIGLSVGQSIAWTARDGRRHALTVEAVEPPSPQGG